jgi:hypothetical protein
MHDTLRPDEGPEPPGAPMTAGPPRDPAIRPVSERGHSLWGPPPPPRRREPALWPAGLLILAFFVLLVLLYATFLGAFFVPLIPLQGPCSGPGQGYLSVQIANPSAWSNASNVSHGNRTFDLYYTHCYGPTEAQNLTFAFEDDHCAAIAGIVNLTVENAQHVPVAVENETTWAWTSGGATPLPQVGYLATDSDADLANATFVVRTAPAGTIVLAETFGSADPPSSCL